ncbi:MAG TPA: hypothetical protein VN698_06405 [Bacteroidia bacterium]|nr:hypothetical protein [Bacteroidia bacterium]
MKKHHILVTLLLLFSVGLFAQNLDSLKLTGAQIPEGYTLTKTNNCISIQACTFYEDPGMYGMLIGKLKNKTIQNFDSKKDKGSIMYFEFQDGFKGEGFLGPLLWGGDKPTKEHPEQYFAKGNFLIIWSFVKTSPIIKPSQAKVKGILK